MDLTGGRHPVELVEKALEGALTHQEEGILAEHLKACPECSGEMEFARRSRSALAVTGSDRGPDPEEMNGMLARLENRMREGGEKGSRIPALAGIVAASLILAWITGNPGRISGWLATKPAVELSAAGMGLSQAELREAMRFYRIDGPADGFMRSPLLAVQVADFESMAELSGVSVAGGGNFSLTGDARTGKLSFLVDPSPAGRSGVKILLPVGRLGPGVVPVAVSVWIKGGQVASVSLSARVSGGEALEGTVVREAKPGQWVWAFLPLPAFNPGEISRLAELGIGISSEGPVSLDHVELWCRGGGGG